MDLFDLLMGFVREWGYYLVFFGTLLEGETFVALAGFAAYQGYLALPVIIPIAIVGATLGDTLFFLFGRRKGREFLARRPRMAERADRMHAVLERHQYALIFGSRFMYGFRTIIPIMLGTSKISFARFAVLNLSGAIVWGLIFAFGGYVFGGAIESFLGNMKKVEGVIAALAVTIFVVAQYLGWARRRDRRREEADPLLAGDRATDPLSKHDAYQ